MPNSIHALDQYDYIRISGADRISFLQGQLSCNTELLSEQRSLSGALCNLKGRVIADFRLVALDETIIMQCASGMADKILSTLNKYAVFSKVELVQLEAGSSEAPIVLGLLGDGIDTALRSVDASLPDEDDEVSHGADCSVIRLSGSIKRVEIWLHTAAAKSAFLAASDIQPDESLEAWSYAQIAAGRIHVTPELSEAYTPQLLNYDISGLIDFKKGCYTGQEIVARMFYRGTPKQRLYLVAADRDIGESTKVEAVGGDGSGGSEILAFSNHQSPSLALAILACEATESGQAYQLSDQPGSKITIQSLPYADS